MKPILVKMLWGFLSIMPSCMAFASPHGGSPTSATATTMTASKKAFAILDHDHIMQEAVAAQKARKKIDVQRSLFLEELTKEEEKLRESEKQLLDTRQNLSDEEYSQKRQEFEKNIAEIHKIVAERRNQLETTFNNAREKVVEAILKVVGEIAHERGYEVVLPRSMIFYAAESHDITEEVLIRLNKYLPEVNLENQPLKVESSS